MRSGLRFGVHFGLRFGARAAALAIALGGLAGGCGAAGTAPERPARADRCDPADLAGCERAVAAALAEGRAARELLDEYLDARAAKDPADPWVRLWREATAADARSRPAPLIVVEGPAPASAQRPGAKAATWVEPGALPAPGALDADGLLLALGEAAGYEHIVHVRGGAAHQLFPRDPLAPFLAGLPPVVGGPAALLHLDSDLLLASTLRRAFDAAGAFRYVDAARAADALAAEVARRDPNDETVLRARYALVLLAGAGVSLEPPGDAPAEPDPAPPPPSPRDTPYADLLRVRLAKDERAAFRERGPAVLRALPADRREALSNLLAEVRGCAPALSPPMEDARDLVFASRLAGALAPVAGAPAPGTLPLKEWLPRYDVLVSSVASTRTMWAHAPSVLYQRGDAQGLSLSGTPTYRRVTELGLAHLGALKELALAEPERFRALSQVSLAYSPGVLGDERLREAVIDLSQATVQRKLAVASDAEGVWSGLVTGVIMGMSYPPAVQPAHYLALQGAFTAKLRGDLTQRAGWGAASLYAVDALYRVLMDQSPDLPFSTAQIARALSSDPALPYPGLAELASSVSRYLALGIEKKLDPDQTDAARFPPERRKAREALQRAIAALADEPAPAGLLDDLTTFADGLIAVASLELAKKPDPPPDTCAADSAGPSPAARRAIARLADVRRRILLSPRYKAEGGAWVRRARLLTTILSDALDLIGAPPRKAREGEPRVRFTLSTAEAEAAIESGMRGWEERELAEAFTGVYGLARALLEAPSAERFVRESGGRVRRTLGAVHAFFRKDAGGGSAGVALLDALAKMPIGDTSASLGELLVGYAKAFSAAGQRDQSDLWLLTSLLSAALAEGGSIAPAIEHAEQQRSRTAWALRYLDEVGAAKRGKAPDPSTYAEAMRAATDDACTKADPGPMLAVMEAVRAFASGKRAEARAALDRVLEDADAKGLSVPRMTYRYEEKTATRIFQLTFNISYGAGLLEGPNTFQVGFGLKTPGEPGGSMTASLSPDGGADEAARYYVHAAAITAVYHLLEGDRERGAAAARRAIQALTFGLRLGDRVLVQQDTGAWGKDARATLAVAAQLAAESGQPMLAGDLWTVVRALVPRDADDDAVAELLDPPPFGLAAVKDQDKLYARTRRSLATLADPLPCTEAKLELGGLEEPACDAYPLALSLRVADALKKLPHLRRAGSASQCGPLRSLDAFLTAAERGTYDPDAFTQAVEALRADGRVYDAAVLLSRQRQESHCSPAITGAARALGRAASLGPSLRADLLSVAVNCTSAALTDAVVEDLLALEAETRRLPDLGRNLRVVFFVVELGLRDRRWDVLARLAGQPDFVERWMRVSPYAATAALLIGHAAAALAAGTEKGAGVAAPGDATYELLCQTFPPGDRAGLCADVAALRGARGLSAEQRRRKAEDALRGLLKQALGP